MKTAKPRLAILRNPGKVGKPLSRGAADVTAEGGEGGLFAPLTEQPAWTEPTRTIVLTSEDGVMRGHVVWIASDVTLEFLHKLEELLELTHPKRSPLRMA